IKMASRKKCLILGLTVFLWLGLYAQNVNQNETCRLLRKFNLTGYVEAENHTVVIGGLFPVHYRTMPTSDSDEEIESPMCEGFNFRGFRWMKTMIHTIKEINERKDILPEHTLGYQIFDNCFSTTKAMESALVFLTGQEEYKPNYKNSTGKYLVAIIGAGGSTMSVAVSRILQSYSVLQLWNYFRNIKFTTHDGRKIETDFFGDIVRGYYDILNWHMDNAGNIAFVKVGEYKFTTSKYELVLPKNSTLFWKTESYRLPDSVCTKVCSPGTRRKNRPGQPLCCFDCIPCEDGYVSEKPGQRLCDPCGEDNWSNPQKNKCVPKLVEFLAYEEALGYALVILSIFGALVALAVTVVYVIHRHTPLAKANDQELSFLIQMSLVITVLSSILFIGKPYNWTCMARQVTLALGFCLCLSSILGKTISLFFAYRISKSKTRLISMHPIFRKLIVLICVVGEIGVCTAYLMLKPPRMVKNIEPQNVKIIFECNEGSIEFLCSIFAFDVLLALLCFLTTFVARKLPDNYYEGKCITFGMLVFFIVWISFVPAYLSTKGKFKVAVEIFAILASSYGLLGCIFLPKCFIILLRPKRNTDETVGGRVPTVDRSIQLASTSVSSELNTTVSTVLDE
uniref:Vomeronasal 2 receptor, 46 n=1 Tax=Rattus norvegicus TaxID=10116 RepID=A0A8I6ADM9_RAT